jgi:hypothetical protein
MSDKKCQCCYNQPQAHQFHLFAFSSQNLGPSA